MDASRFSPLLAPILEQYGTVSIFDFAFGQIILNRLVTDQCFWEELEKTFQLRVLWSALKIGDAEIPKDKVARLLQLKLQIPMDRVAEIANRLSEEEWEWLTHSELQPIVKAVYLGELSLVRELIRNGASANVVFRLGNACCSLVDLAVFLDREDILLLILGEIPSQNLVVKTPIAQLRLKPQLLTHLVRHGYLEALRLHDENGYTPLHNAAKHGDLEELKFWISVGCHVDIASGCSTCEEVETPLHTAVHHHQSHIVRYLLEQNANPNAAHLQIHAMHHHAPMEIHQLLLSYGASSSARQQDASLVAHASWKDRKDLIELIATTPPKSGTEIQQLLEEMQLNRKTLQEADLEKRDAAIAKVVAAWIDRLTTLTANTTYEGIPLLHHVIICCDESLALKALERGSDPNTTTTSKITAFQLAVTRNYQTLMSELMRRGANIHDVDYTDATAINHALNYPRTLQVAKLLTESHGALSSANPFYVYDSFKQLRIEWLSSYADQLIEENPHLHEQWKSIYLAKLCAHLFAFGGKGRLIPKETTTPALLYWRDGMLSPRMLVAKMGKVTQNLREIPAKTRNLISALCKFAASDNTLSNRDYLRRIQAGRPTLVLTASPTHSWNILFYKTYCIFCNISSEKIMFYQYDQSKLTEKDIGIFRYTLAYTDSADDVKEEIAGIAARIALTLISKNAEYNKFMNWEPQTTGNCTFHSFLAAIGALLVLTYVANINNDAKTAYRIRFRTDITPAKYQAHLMDKWLLGVQLHYVDKYVTYHEKKERIYKPDLPLLQKIKGDLTVKDKRNRKIGAIIRKIHTWDLPQQMEPHVPADRDGCFSHMICKTLPNDQVSYSSLLKYRSSYPAITAEQAAV